MKDVRLDRSLSVESFKVGGPPKDPSPLQRALDREQESLEIESTEGPPEVTDVPGDSPVTSTATTVAPPKDTVEVVTSFTFDKAVVGFELKSPPPNCSTEEAQQFFQANQNKAPTAISLIGNSAVFTYGDQSLKIDLGKLERMLTRGEVGGNSRAIQSLIVAQTIHSLKLSPSITRNIIDGFMKDLAAKVPPQMARVNAYSASVSAIALGPDPKGQLEKDMGAVEQFCKGFEKLNGKPAAANLRSQFGELMTKRMTAIANKDWAAARDHQETMRVLAGQVGMKGVCAPAMADLELPANPIEAAAITATQPQTIDNEIVQNVAEAFEKMAKGDSTDAVTDGEGGIKIGLGISVKAPIPSEQAPTLVKVAVEGSARALGKSSSTIERDENGDFVLTERRYIGGGLKGSASGTAIVELAGGDVGGDIGHLKLTKLKFGSAADLAKYLTAQNLGDMLDVSDVPIKQVGAAPTAKPLPGRFVVVEESSGFATRTETQVRHVGITRGSEKASAQGGGVWNAIRRFLPNFPNRTMSTETTRFKTTTGSSVVERNYASKSETGNTILKILTLGIYGRTTVRNNISLKLRQVTPPPVGSGTDKVDLASTFKPSVSIQIDSGKVNACKTESAVDLLVKKETERIVAMQKAANKDAGKEVFDVSTDGQEYTKQAIRNCFMLVYNEHNRVPQQDERQLKTDKDIVANDLSVTISKTGLAGGWTSGGMVTFKLPFAEQKNAPGSFRANVGGVEVGMTTVSGKRFSASIGVDTEDIPGSPVKFGVNVYMKASSTDSEYQQVIGRGTIPPPTRNV